MPAPAGRRPRIRADLRSAGLRPVRIWVPDRRMPGFAEECRRQAQIVNAAAADDADLAGFLDAAIADWPVPGQ